jgi:hypothetical protein
LTLACLMTVLHLMRSVYLDGKDVAEWAVGLMWGFGMAALLLGILTFRSPPPWGMAGGGDSIALRISWIGVLLIASAAVVTFSTPNQRS